MHLPGHPLGNRLHMASQSDDYARAAGHLRQYATGHLAVQRKLPLDINDGFAGQGGVVAHYSALRARTFRGGRTHEGRPNGNPGARRVRACATRLS